VSGSEASRVITMCHSARLAWRFGRSISITTMPALAMCRAMPAPEEPVPSIAHFGDHPKGLEPGQQRLVAGPVRREGFGSEQASDAVEGASYGDLVMGIDATDDRARRFYDGHGHPFLSLGVRGGTAVPGRSDGRAGLRLTDRPITPLEPGGPRLVVDFRTYRCAGFRRWTIRAQPTSSVIWDALSGARRGLARVDQDGAVLGIRHAVDERDLNAWCRTHLGSEVNEILFCEGYLSTVIGVELTSTQRVVVKLRTPAPRLSGCALVHRRAFERGFPCPEPLVDLVPMGPLVASAEMLRAGGDLFPTTSRAPTPFAAALAWLVDVAPKADEMPSLDPRPPWTGPDFAAPELWPTPDDRTVDLNASAGPTWVDRAGQVARDGLASSPSALAVGHGDWYTGNLRWKGNGLYAVWDWDSAIAAPESVIAGLASAVYPATDAGTEATVAESEAFLDAYQVARGRRFRRDELTQAWAAGLWVRAFDAKKQFATEDTAGSLTEAEALERGRRALGRR
jgi:hypothetical protein